MFQGHVGIFLEQSGDNGCTPNSVPMVFTTFSSDSVEIHTIQGVFAGISHRGIQLSSDGPLEHTSDMEKIQYERIPNS